MPGRFQKSLTDRLVPLDNQVSLQDGRKIPLHLFEMLLTEYALGRTTAFVIQKRLKLTRVQNRQLRGILNRIDAARPIPLSTLTLVIALDTEAETRIDNMHNTLPLEVVSDVMRVLMSAEAGIAYQNRKSLNRRVIRGLSTNP